MPRILAYTATALLLIGAAAASWLAAAHGHEGIATGILAAWIVVAGIAWNRDPA